MGPHAAARLQQKRPLEVRVPDLLWKDGSLPEGARYLWCHLRMRRNSHRRFHLRPAARGHRAQPAQPAQVPGCSGEEGLDSLRPVGRTTVEVQALWPNALLSQLSGYSHNSLIKYLRALREKGFPVGAECRVARRKALDLTVEGSGDLQEEEVSGRAVEGLLLGPVPDGPDGPAAHRGPRGRERGAKLPG